MKRHLLIAAMLPGALLALGNPLTPQQALSRARNASGHHSLRPSMAVEAAPAATLSSTPGQPTLYVFNGQEEGFLIVSADDCAIPVLGYSDTGRYDSKDVPPQLQYWLDFYSREIAWAASSGRKAAPASLSDDTSASMPAIAPLTQSKWDQGSPYNDDCPLDNGKRSVTGCVATAMAQAMYYHQWPAKGTGSHSYNWNNTELSMDFASTTFDWTAMTPTYDKDSSSAAKAAVATLMYACGVSVDMDYTSDESGASSMTMVSSLYKYFDYDRSMTFPQRSYYGEADWENMVYSQLSQNLPVLYCGQSYEGGHQFICDGYDGNGYFHFNWGWSGMSDGYYLLSALDPLEQGIGGSASDSGFNYDQGIVLNMKPAESGSTVTPLIYCYGNFGVYSESGEAEAYTLGKTVDFSGDYFNFACDDISGYPGVKLVDQNGNTSYLKHAAKLGFAAFSGYARYSVTLPSDLAAGTYTVTPVFMPDGSSDWTAILCPLSGVQALTMTVANGQATFADDITNSLQLTGFTLNSPIYLGEDFSASFTLTNTGTTEYYGEYLLYLFDSNGYEVAPSSDINSIDLLPGQSVKVDYVGAFPEEVSTDEGTEDVNPGTYYIGVFTHFTKQEIYVDPNPVTVNAAPAQTELEILNLTVNGGKDVVDTSAVKFNGTVSCVEGYFAGRLKIAVFKAGTTSTDLSGDTGYVFVGEGDTAEFEATLNISSADGDSFFAVVYRDDSQISDEYPFKVDTSGVSAIDAAEAISITADAEGLSVTAQDGVAAVEVFAIDGRLITKISGGAEQEVTVSASDVVPGEYVVVATDSAGRTLSRPVILGN